MKRTPRLVLVPAALMLALVMLAGCGGTSSSSGTDSASDSSTRAATVKITGSGFSPDSVEIKVGESVTWTNDTYDTHSVVTPGRINSGLLANGESYTKELDKAGTYEYNCQQHPDETGEVVVQ